MSRQIIIPHPSWDSELHKTILDLEKLRRKHLIGEIPKSLFFQLKNIFQILETLGSARIEGNKTTLAEYVEKIIDQQSKIDENHREINNLDQAIEFIEANTDDTTVIDQSYVFELHKIVTKELLAPPRGEGSWRPGELRKVNVTIQKSQHRPPDYLLLPDYFTEFIDFINYSHQEPNQLLMVAIAHHRFAYIHPFDNGNGRMGRLLNYALLIKLGFNVKSGRIINPSSVFYTNRNKYYAMLGQADSLSNQDVLSWCEYFLLGLKNEINKVDSLLDRYFVVQKILFPSIKIALERKLITSIEFDILKYLISKDNLTIKAAELDKFEINSSLQKSRFIAKLRSKKMLVPTTINGRFYTLNFISNYLLRGIISSLETEGFVAEFLQQSPDITHTVIPVV